MKIVKKSKGSDISISGSENITIQIQPKRNNGTQMKKKHLIENYSRKLTELAP